MDFFSEAMDRLKHELRVSKDAEVAEWLGMSRTAFSERKKRGSFPMRELVDRAAGTDVHVDYVLTGRCDEPRAAEKEAAYLVGKIPAKLRALRELHGLPTVCAKGEVTPEQWTAYEAGNGGGYPQGFLMRITSGFSLDPQAFLLDAQDEPAQLSPVEKDLLTAYRMAGEADKELIRRVALRFSGPPRKD